MDRLQELGEGKAARSPLVDLRMLGNRTFLVGCLLSFVLGMGLFGSVYLMPVFLGFATTRPRSVR